MKQLPKGPLTVDDFQIVHGSPLDEDEYLLGAAEVAQAFAYVEHNLTFFGHTHVQGGFLLSRGHLGMHRRTARGRRIDSARS